MGKVDPKIITLLEKFKTRIKGRYSVARLILFGSYARGNPMPNSDIDLVVVVKNKDADLVSKLMHEWHTEQDINYPVDFVDYTEKEFNKLAKRITLANVVSKEGIEI
ncbi:MAG: nucleotidyltransferase domain-containing protein [Candidatus Micrarchaeales archaeon]